MRDGFITGWQHAMWLLGYVSAMSWVVALLVLLFVGGWRVAGRTAHRTHVARLARAHRRAGRATPVSDERWAGVR